MTAPANAKNDIKFTIDGETFTTTDHRRPAGDLLDLAGVEAADYDLGEVVGGRPEPKHYADDEDVTIHPDSRFVTLRVGPAPVE